MLLQFNFTNFKSFRDNACLDLTATKIKEYDNHVFSAGKEKVLPVAAIYGANASGKSNIYEAFNFMALYVVSSFEFGGESNIINKKNEKLVMHTTPFLFDETSMNKESSFEVFFIDDKDPKLKTYNYGFSLDRDGIVEEWLNCKSKTSNSKNKRIFYRSRKEKDFSGLPTKTRNNIEMSLQDETLVVSLGAKLKIPELTFIRDWFNNGEWNDFGDPILNLYISNMLPINFPTDEKIQDNVVKYLSSFDKSIVGFKVRERKDKDGKSIFQVSTKHKTIGPDKYAYIPLEQESSGTLKMFALYQSIQNVLEHGSVMFVDELNAKLHPLLVRTLLITFLDPTINKNKAQLIFTTHDAWLLSSNMLRRDEIWFVEKNNDGISSLYSLADFVDDEGQKIRKDESYEKNYLLGKYGAIPSLKIFDMLTGENDVKK